MKECDGRNFGWEQLFNIDPTRAACGTIIIIIMGISNVPRQLKLLDIESIVGMECKGVQGGMPPCADIAAESLIRFQAAGERADLVSNLSTANGKARAESPPGTWHVIMSDT